MSRRWSLVVVAVAAVLATGLLARVDGAGRPEIPVGPEPPPPSPTPVGEEWQPVGAWTPIANSPGGSRRDHTAVWTGSCPAAAPPRSCGEVIIWGGRMVVGPRSDGAAYDLVTDTWRRVPPAPREPLEWGGVPGAWTGAELVVWAATNADFAGGGSAGGPRGAAHDPVAGSWRSLPEAPLEPRFGHTATWTGAEVIIWGGRRAGGPDHGELLTDGAAYDPAADAWRRLADAPLTVRRDHTAVWLPEAGRLVVWGGVARRDGGWAPLLDGAAYDPAADAWDPIPSPPAAPAPDATAWEPAAARLDEPERLAAVAPLAVAGDPVVALYDPRTERWELVPAGATGARGGAYVGGGDRIVTWGGTTTEAGPAGTIHWPRTNAWRTAPEGREPVTGETATWTDAGLLVWGGDREGTLWNPDGAQGPGVIRARPQGTGEARDVALPVGHETGWGLVPPAAPAAPAVEVRGAGAEVQVWLEARSRRGWRIRRLAPTAIDCTAEHCVHRFDPVPERLPGPVEVRLLNTGGAALSVTVTAAPRS